MAGYPGHPLPKKLGIKAGHKVCLLNAPGAFERTIVSDGVRITHDLRYALVDVVVMFVDSLEELERRFTDVVGRLHPAGGFWVAWRRSSRRVSEEVVRRIALAAGMAANKVCSIDASYSGVRLVMRTGNREAMSYRIEPPPISRRSRRPTARIAPRIVRATSAGAGSALRRARARSTK
ncbi:MAG: DUF3052 family protein [Deltaproteobacteria bacterium]|nr:DUF3052 family protein [Deltaproteobacteria bacterium]